MGCSKYLPQPKAVAQLMILGSTTRSGPFALLTCKSLLIA